MSDKLKQGFPVATLGAIVAIAVLQSIALIKGIDGTMFATSLMAIAGLGGYIMGSKFPFSGNSKEVESEWESSKEQKTGRTKSRKSATRKK